MYTSVLILDKSDPQLKDILAHNRPGVSVSFGGGYSITDSQEFGEFIIELGHRVTEIPPRLNDLKIKAIAVVKRDAFPTRALDGDYREQRDNGQTIEAYVETSVGNGGPYQYLHVVGSYEQSKYTTFEQLQVWMTDLMNGKKNDYNRDPVAYGDVAIPRTDLQLLHIDQPRSGR